DSGEVAINLPGMSARPPAAPLAPLAPALRDNIRAQVANDVFRIGVGSAMVLAFIPIFIMLLIAKYFIDRSRRATAFAEQKKKEADVSNVNRQITEARLQALQAQVEPHFLYNTLANVQALTEVDPAQANQMTGHLIQYLRSSLPKMRENTSTVGQEIELVRAYLNILKMRMGERLAFDIDCPADLNSVSFPPLMLPSLVENAIKHGLEPQREGGRIDVIVQRVFTATGERIRVTVKDTGRGLTGAPTQAGGGVGLTNIRERLIAIYGDAGSLTLESNDPKGAIASIEVPIETGNIAGAPGNSAFASMAPPARPVKPVPKGWWGHTRYAVATTHGVWAKIMSVTFITLMIALAVVFGLLLAGLYTGMLPIKMGAARLDGIEGMAIGTLGLLVAFGVVALALLVVVGVLYGLGLLVAGLIIIIPLIFLISSVPALAPFVLVGLAIYWFWWRKRDKQKSITDDL
ncbi:MAG: histidine kinase, partial [Betaproteobacteria bacterium]